MERYRECDYPQRVPKVFFRNSQYDCDSGVCVCVCAYVCVENFRNSFAIKLTESRMTNLSMDFQILVLRHWREIKKSIY